MGDDIDTSKLSDLRTALNDIDGITVADDADAKAVAKAISGANEATAKKIAIAFEAALKSTTAHTVTVAADATTAAQIAGLAAGYYLVKDTADVTGEGTQTRFIMEVVSNVSVTEKANVPSVTKKVKEKDDGKTSGAETDWQDAADYDIGDAIPYKLEGTLPSDFADYKTYKVYTFTDTLSAGLTAPAKTDVKVTLDTEDGTDLVAKNIFEVKVDGQEITVSLKDGVDLKTVTDPTFSASNKIIVTYSATLNNSAVIGSAGNPNTVKLEYTNNPNGEQEGKKGTTPEDKVTVFTYEIKALKVEPDGDAIDQAAYNALDEAAKKDYVKVGDKWQKTKALSGAGFTLYKEVAGSYVAVGTEVTGVTTFEFKGTDAGKYKLVETTVPAGYNKAEDVEITVTATYDTESANPLLKTLEVTPATAGFTVTTTPTTTPDTEHITTDGIIEGKILNQKGSVLPSTGGIGTTIFYVAGSILVLAAAILLITKRRMGAND